MPSDKEFPPDFWSGRKSEITSLNVLAELLNEQLQQIKIIKGFSQVLLKINYSSNEERLSDIERILESAIYLESIIEAARQYMFEYHKDSS